MKPRTCRTGQTANEVWEVVQYRQVVPAYSLRLDGGGNPGSKLPSLKLTVRWLENPPFWWYLQGKMGIFHGQFVSFREGRSNWRWENFIASQILVYLIWYPTYTEWTRGIKIPFPKASRNHKKTSNQRKIQVPLKKVEVRNYQTITANPSI